MKNKQLERIELAASTSAFLKAGESGLLVLPERVADALAALDRATEALQTHVIVDLEAARADYAAKVADALRAGTAPPPAKNIEQVAMMARQHEEVRRALTTAEMQLFTELRSVIPSAELVIEHVRPVLLSSYDQARKLLETHGPLLGQPADQAISAGPVIAKAWGEFGKLTTKLTELRDLHRNLTDSAVVEDTRGTYSEWQEAPNDPRLWGPRGAVQLASPWRPWPSEARPRLAWLLNSALSVWVPTSSERDARHAEVAEQTPRPRPAGAVVVGVA